MAKKRKQKRLVRLCLIELSLVLIFGAYLVYIVRPTYVYHKITHHVQYEIKAVRKTAGMQLKQNPNTVKELKKAVKKSDQKEFFVEIPDNIPATPKGSELIREIIINNPDVFGSYDLTLFSTERNPDKIVYIKFRYDEKQKEKTEKTMQAVKEICDEARHEKTQSDQVFYVVRKIAKSCTYNKYVEDCESAYGCLVKGRAKCTGYAESMQLCMQELGIPSRYKLSINMDHIWNEVNINGEWIDIDVTGMSAMLSKPIVEKSAPIWYNIYRLESIPKNSH